MEENKELLEAEKEKKVNLEKDCEENLALAAEEVLKDAQKKEGVAKIVSIFMGKAK